MQRAIQTGAYSEALSLVPNTIEKAFEFPKVFEIEQIYGKETLLNMVETELVFLAAKFSTSGNLTDYQSKYVASELIEMYPKESVADFKTCFDMLAKGKFGTVYRIDANVIFESFQKYLEDKYEFLENRLMKEKDDAYNYSISEVAKIATNEKAIDYLQQMLDNIKSIDEKKPAPITEKDIREEGKERPKAKPYPSNTYEFSLMYSCLEEIKKKYLGHIRNLFEVESFQMFQFGEHKFLAPDKDTAQKIWDEASELFRKNK